VKRASNDGPRPCDTVYIGDGVLENICICLVQLSFGGSVIYDLWNILEEIHDLKWGLSRCGREFHFSHLRSPFVSSLSPQMGVKMIEDGQVSSSLFSESY
jgi:hypothetical protein